MLELRALGNAEIATDTSTLTPSQEIVFAAALYLVLERERKVSRAGLAELLWPAVDPSIRAHRLRQTLLQLKKVGVPIVADRDSVKISTQVQADVDEVQSSGITHFEPARSLEFLPGYSPRFSEAFADWVDRKRSQIASVCSRALITEVGRQRARANWTAVEKLARTILQLDAYNETAVLALAEACAMRGQKRDAVSMIDDYLREIGGNTDIRLPATLLRKRILDSPVPNPAVTLPPPAFVGRETEVEHLTRRLRQAQNGHGGACLLVGEPGIGKSRLAEEVAHFGALQGIRTATVSCQRSNVDRPLSVLVDLAPALRDMPGSLGVSQETLAALRRLTEFDTRSTELTAATTESGPLHRALRNAILDLLDAITDEVSLLLVFDDVQWIDRTSADILSEMIVWAQNKRLLLIVTSRSSEIGKLEMFVRMSADVIELPALTDSAAEVLLRTIISHCDATTESESRWILDVGEGNPFFLQELAKHWLESRGRIEAPSSVNKVLRDRIARLNPVSLKVLQACTVLAQSSTVERIEGVLEYSAHELLGAIQELSAAGMLSASGDSAEITPLSLRTRHDLLANTVLESMSPASRAFLHRRAGMVLETALSGDRLSTALLWACAFHWHHAGERDRALSLVRSYSEHLLDVGLPQDATKALDTALEYCSTDEQRLSILARQVDALQMAGEWERSKQVLLYCRELRKSTTPNGDQHDAFEIMLFDASFRSSFSALTLLAETTRCVECDDAAAAHRLQAAVIALKLASDVDPFVMDSVYRQVEPMLAHTSVNDPTRIELEMVYHSLRGDGTRGMKAARSVVSIARQSKDPFRLTRALTNAANSYRINGATEDAEHCLNEAFECSLKHHLIERAAMALQGLVRLHLFTGDFALARALLQQRKALPTAAENLLTTTELHIVEVRVALKEGNFALAAKEFSLIPAASADCSPGRRGAYLALEIQIRVAQERFEDPLRELTSELERIHTTLWALGSQDFEAETLFLALKAIGEEERAISRLTEYFRAYRRELRPPAFFLGGLLMDTSALIHAPLSRRCESVEVPYRDE